MNFNLLAAVIAGLAGTAVMTGMMLGARALKLPAVDAHGILGYVRDAEHAGPVGYLAHALNGVVFAIGYAFVFTLLDVNIYLMGAFLGVIHWLIVGWLFAFAPRVHAGMRTGAVQPAGPYMIESLGYFGFFAGLAGHIIFGLTVAMVYGALAG